MNNLDNLTILEEPEPTLDTSTDEPDATFVKSPPRARHSVAYEKKVRSLLNMAMRVTIQTPATVPDAAAIIMYGPDVSRSLGDLAAHDVRVRRAIDFISEGADNPYIAAVAAIAPLALQILRNHEPTAEVSPVRKVRIPFTKRFFTVKFKIKLGKLRNMSNDPQEFTAHVLSNEDIVNELQRQGICVASQNGSNGRAN